MEPAIAAARAGKHVIVEKPLEITLSRCDKIIRECEKAGVKLRWYKPLRIYSIYKIGKRTHRKILTVDGRIGFTGGFAIDDRWLGNARNPDEWRDTNVQVEGPVVTQLQAIFMEDWVHTTGEVLHGTEQFPPVAASGSVRANNAPNCARSACEVQILCPLISQPPSTLRALPGGL